ncbi:MAG: short-chain fatty acid transporter [Deltaproteobacteria bacterium]|nr:short-chain fatty acid transporter [Deltaproteobacteria bacterium]
MDEKGRVESFALSVEKYVPDAITSAVFMVVILFIFASLIGVPLSQTVDAYYKGLWMLLAFTMQMTLIITLAAVVGASPIFRRGIRALAVIPKTQFQVIALGTLVTAVLGYIYWGLAITLGPVIAIYFCGEAERKGIKVDFTLCLASVFAAHSVWQYGLSSSGPLLVATPGHFLDKVTGTMPLSTTIWSPAAITLVIAFTIVLLIVTRLLMPRVPKTIAEFPESYKLISMHEPEPDTSKAVAPDSAPTASIPAEALTPFTFSQKLEKSSIIGIVLMIGLIVWLYHHFGVKKAGLDFNSLNVIFLFLCFLLHRNVHNFTQALQEGIKSAWAVVVIYHLYATAAGILQFTPAGETIAKFLAAISTTYTFPLLIALSGTIVAVFVPSSGGQWAIQGLVTSKAAEAVGLSFQKGLLSLGVGDQMGNLCSPFWYVVVAGIARIDFRKFFGYGLVFSAVWFVLGVICFTLLPC